MRIFKLLVVAFTFVMASASYAETKIAMADPMRALAGAELVQKAAAGLEQELADELLQVQSLEVDIREIQQKLQIAQETGTMDNQQLLSLKQDGEAKVIQLRSISQILDKRRKDFEQQLLVTMKPKLDAAIQAVMEEGGYSMIMHQQALLYADPRTDVTMLITEKLNLQD